MFTWKHVYEQSSFINSQILTLWAVKTLQAVRHYQQSDFTSSQILPAVRFYKQSDFTSNKTFQMYIRFLWFMPICQTYYYTFIACRWGKYENLFTQEYHIPWGQCPRGIWYSWVNKFSYFLNLHAINVYYTEWNQENTYM
jgi:hypothetical protein